MRRRSRGSRRVRSGATATTARAEAIRLAKMGHTGPPPVRWLWLLLSGVRGKPDLLGRADTEKSLTVRLVTRSVGSHGRTRSVLPIGHSDRVGRQRRSLVADAFLRVELSSARGRAPSRRAASGWPRSRPGGDGVWIVVGDGRRRAKVGGGGRHDRARAVARADPAPGATAAGEGRGDQRAGCSCMSSLSRAFSCCSTSSSGSADHRATSWPRLTSPGTGGYPAGTTDRPE